MVGPTYPFRGGISHSVTLFCKNLSKKHDVKLLSFKRQFPSILYPGRDQIDRYKKKIKDFDVEYIIDTLNPLTWIKTFTVVKKEKPDLLVINWWTPFFTPAFFTISFLARFLTETKISIICQNLFPHETSFLDKFLTKLVFKNAHFFLTLSKEDVGKLKRLIPDAKVEYIVEPTWEEHFVSGKIDKREAQKTLSLEGNVILFFGFVREYKGLMYLIESLPKVLKEIDVDLLIVGEFWDEKQKYLDKIKENGIEKNIKIIDKYVSNKEVGLYFSASDVVVLPYVSSTESGIIQVAFGFNKPVIATNVGGNPDLIEHDKTGLLVPPRDPDALAEAIIYYFREGKEKQFEEEMKKKVSVFEWDDKKEKIFFHGLFS
jgi:glycosyltransferase involved in cell wall biosynthesis